MGGEEVVVGSGKHAGRWWVLNVWMEFLSRAARSVARPALARACMSSPAHSSEASTLPSNVPPAHVRVKPVAAAVVEYPAWHTG